MGMSKKKPAKQTPVLKNPHAVAMGRLGGLVGGLATSRRKKLAARENGKLGGRPLSPERKAVRAVSHRYSLTKPERAQLYNVLRRQLSLEDADTLSPAVLAALSESNRIVGEFKKAARKK